MFWEWLEQFTLSGLNKWVYSLRRVFWKMPWQCYSQSMLILIIMKVVYFIVKFPYLFQKIKYIKIAFLVFTWKNCLWMWPPASKQALVFLHFSSIFHVPRVCLKLVVFGFAFMSNQSSVLLFCFIGQDAELSGTLSLVLTQCCKRIKDTVQKLASDHKDIHSSVSRVGKAIDKVWC